MYFHTPQWSAGEEGRASHDPHAGLKSASARLSHNVFLKEKAVFKSRVRTQSKEPHALYIKISSSFNVSVIISLQLKYPDL